MHRGGTRPSVGGRRVTEEGEMTTSRGEFYRRAYDVVRSMGEACAVLPVPEGLREVTVNT